jgi:hypothetical protein
MRSPPPGEGEDEANQTSKSYAIGQDRAGLPPRAPALNLAMVAARQIYVVDMEKSAMPSIRAPVATLEYEIAQEKASALGRLGRRLEVALAALAAFDAAHVAGSGEHRELRRTLVAEAGQALWYLVVQRDACGLYGSKSVMTDYRVPIEVRNCMGPLPRQTAG